MRKTIEMDPTFDLTYWFLGQAYEDKGQLAEAIAQYEKATQLNPDPAVLASLARAYALAGRKEEARKIIESLTTASPANTHARSFYEPDRAPTSAALYLISDALPFGRLWYGEPNAISNAIGYAKFFSRSHDAVTRVYDEAGNVIDAHEHAGNFAKHL